MQEQSNSAVYQTVAILTVAAGIILGAVISSEDSLIFGLFVIISLTALGILILAVSEVLKKLDRLQDVFEDVEKRESVLQSNEWTLSEDDRQRIMRYYEKKHIEVKEIVPSPFEDFCLVRYSNGCDLVEVGGFEPVVIKGEKMERYPRLMRWFLEASEKTNI